MSSDESTTKSSVLFIRHFPHGFGEREMGKFFSQFGDILNVRLVRSKKTGRPKKVAYVQFRDADVAKIAADTMDNYLMFGKLMRCGLVSCTGKLSRLFPQRRIRTTVEKHKWKVNGKKSEKGEGKCRKKKLSLIAKSRQVLSQFGLSFDPVVINYRTTGKPETGVTPDPTAKRQIKALKTRPLLQQKVKKGAASGDSVSTDGAKKKKSGLKIQTLTASSIGEKKNRKRVHHLK